MNHSSPHHKDGPAALEEPPEPVAGPVEPEADRDRKAETGRLAGLARQGDPAAFARLAEMHWGEVFRLAFHRVHSRADAEDLAQDAFLRAQKGIGGLNDPAEFRSWLFSIALNAVRDFQRRQRFRFLFRPLGGEGETEIEYTSDSPLALEETLSQEFWREIARFTRKLPAMEREVFTLRFVDELSIPEAAAILNRSQSAVKTHLYRAVKKFKDDRGLLNRLRGIE